MFNNLFIYIIIYLNIIESWYKFMYRILCISDIHGQNSKLIHLLNLVNYNPYKDQLILLGDYTDRGNENVETLKTIMNLKKNGAIILMGNHDELAMYSICDILNGKTENLKLHINCEGQNTFNEFIKLETKQLIEFLNFYKSLDLNCRIDNYLFVHAGVDFSKPLIENDSSDLLWIRKEFIHYRGKKHEDYNNLKIVFGHTTTLSLNRTDKIYKVGNLIGIDCGSIYGGKLLCYDILNKKEYYV